MSATHTTRKSVTGGSADTSPADRRQTRRGPDIAYPGLQVIVELIDDRSARGLASAVTRGARDGSLGAGDKLPPIRTVAGAVDVSPTTVSSAWSMLLRSGVIRTDGRRGTVITPVTLPGSSRYRRALEHSDHLIVDLSTGVPDPSLLPDLSGALRSISVGADTGSYLDAPVLPQLEELLRARWPFTPERLTVVDGALDALDLVVGEFFRFGDRVAVEQPCFPPLLDLLERRGVEILGVRLDDDGPLPVDLRAAVAAGISAFFLQPRAQNPTGAGLTPNRVRRLATELRDSDVLVIENDAAGAVASSPPVTLHARLPDRVLHIHSFSKSHGPDLRLAAVGGPAVLIDRLVERRRTGQGWTSRILQHLLAELLVDDVAVATVGNAREEYDRRRRSFVSALARQGVEVGGRDGTNVWVPVADETATLIRLAGQGIGVAAGEPFSVPGADVATPHVRITCGLLADRHDEVAAAVAEAATTTGRAGGR